MYLLSYPFFTQFPSRHGLPITIKLSVVCQASSLLMNVIISIYLTIIPASSQGIHLSWHTRNLRATLVYSKREFSPCTLVVSLVQCWYLVLLTTVCGKSPTGLIFHNFNGFHSIVNLFMWITALLIGNISLHCCYSKSYTMNNHFPLKTQKFPP